MTDSDAPTPSADSTPGEGGTTQGGATLRARGDEREAPPSADVSPTVTRIGGAGDATENGRGIPDATASAEQKSPTAGDAIGPYRLVRKLGEGGMGAVWEAVHVHLDRRVALKLLPARLLERPEAVARFYREMKAAGRVVHPHVVQAHDAGEANGVHYLAMELVVGADLHQLVNRKGPLSVLHAARALRQAALGLSAAHAQGLVHRDVKPMNLLVGKDGKVKVLDLGLARLAEDAAADASRDGLTTAGMVMGTPDYMAPEQWEDSHSAGPAVDLYALGCTLYFVLTGRAPFADERHVSAVRKMAAHVTEAPPDLASARPDVPAGLCEVYRRLMAKKPEDRPASAAEVAESLLPFTVRPSDADAIGSTGATADGDSQTVASVGTSVLEASSTSPKNWAATPTAAYAPVVDVARPSKPASATAPPFWRRPLVLAGAGGIGAVLVALGVVITITNRDGTKTVIQAPDAKSVEVERNGETVAKVEGADPPPPKTVAPAAIAPRPQVAPLSEANPLPGLAASPADLPGIGRWQIDTRHPRSQVNCFDLSPDGSLIALGTSSGEVRLIDAESLELVRIIPHAGVDVTRVKWHPSGDRFAAGTQLGDVYVLALDGRLLHSLEQKSVSRIVELEWDARGAYLAASVEHGAVRIWHEDGMLESQIEASAGGPPRISFSSDGERLARAGRDNRLCVFRRDGSLIRDFELHGVPRAVAWQPGGTKLAVGTEKLLVMLYDAESDEDPIEVGTGSWPIDLTWNGDGSLLASSTRDTVTIYDASLKPSIETKFPSHETYLAWNSASSELWTLQPRDGDNDFRLAHLDLDLNETKALKWPEAPQWSAVAASSLNGGMLSSGARYANEVFLWTAEGRPLRPLGLEADTSSLDWNREATRLAVRTNGAVSVFDREGKLLWKQPFVERGRVAWSPDGAMLAATSKSAGLQIYFADGALGPASSDKEEGNSAIAWSLDGKVATPGPEGSVRFRQVAKLNLEEVEMISPVRPNGVTGLAPSPDGEEWAVGKERDIWILSTAGSNWQGLYSADRGGHVESIAWSPMGNRILLGAIAAVFLWERDAVDADGKIKRAYDLSGHGAMVNGVCWLDEKRFVSVSADNQIRVWDADSRTGLWTALCLRNDDGTHRPLTIAASGEVLHAEGIDVEEELVYVVEDDAGRLETLRPSEFERRTREAP